MLWKEPQPSQFRHICIVYEPHFPELFQVEFGVDTFRDLPTGQLLVEVLTQGKTSDPDVAWGLFQGKCRPGKAVDVGDGSVAQQFLRV